jgi:hypothetical protein
MIGRASAWRTDTEPADPRALIEVVRSAKAWATISNQRSVVGGQ